MAEYEALLLGLKKARKMGLKCLRVEGDSELIMKQVRKECEARHLCMKRYINVVWDEIELFDAFNITHIGREINKDDDSLARTTTLFQHYITNPYIQHLVEVSFRPHVPDNITAMQVFEDDEQILNFMRCEKEFSDVLIDEMQDLKEVPLIQLKSNHIPVGLVPLESIFDRSNRFLNKAEKTNIADFSMQVDDINIGFGDSPRYIKIEKHAHKRKERKSLSWSMNTRMCLLGLMTS